MESNLPSWLNPVPVRRSRFLTACDQWKRFNIEVALDRIPAFEFSRATVKNVLYFDYQTQLDGNRSGRHGSGRGGVYEGYYVKGVGRTPAAANWNSREDRYHGSGHQSAASALRELLITRAIRAAGSEPTIVPCRTVLAQEREGRLLTLSLKPADFARMSNIAWSLDHFSTATPDFATSILDFERYLRPPGSRDEVNGDPEEIAQAMDGAFRRGLSMFRTFARLGLFWIYLQNNFTLDGRFVDLETPVYLGRPFLGLFEQQIEGTPPRRILGFEEFGFVWNWRLFLSWLRAKLGWLASGTLLERPARQLVREIRKQVNSVFSKTHLLYDDSKLQSEAVRNLAEVLDPGPAARRQITELARFTFRSSMSGREGAIPDLGWRPLTEQPAGPTMRPCRVLAAGLVGDHLGDGARGYAEDLHRLSAIRSAKELVSELAGIERRSY